MNRNKSGEPKGLEALGEIGRRLGDLAEHMKTAFQEGAPMDDMDSDLTSAGKSAQRTFTINTSKGPLTGVAGYSLRMGGLGGEQEPDEPLDAEFRPQRRNKRTHHPHQKAETNAKEDVREPLLDVFVEAHEILITAELSGVSIDDVSVELNDDQFRIETVNARRFETSIALDHAVDPASLVTSLRNGILNVRLQRIMKDNAS